MPNFVWELVIYEHHQVVKIIPIIPLAQDKTGAPL
jgi:hypothetical protein